MANAFATYPTNVARYDAPISLPSCAELLYPVRDAAC